MDIAKEQGVQAATLKALHKRFDGLDEDMKKLIAEKNQRIGWVSAMVLVGTVAGYVISYLLKK